MPAAVLSHVKHRVHAAGFLKNSCFGYRAAGAHRKLFIGLLVRRRTMSITSIVSCIMLAAAIFTSTQAAITVNRATKFQTIEGFGFFGGRGCWWDSEKADYFFSDAWLSLMFENLGATLWRNELYPHVPVTGNSGNQDATWSKQRPCAQAIDAYCRERGVDIKILLSIWSPPKSFKCKLDDDENFLIGQEPSGTVGGNVLDPEEVANFRDWLISGLQAYKDAGLNVYAMSFQNEPYFWQSYNSCFYYQDRSDHYDYKTYMKTINAGIRDFINKNGEKVKTFGSENMLEMEAAKENVEWFYHTPIKKDAAALATLDRWAVHGYTDGINSQSPKSALDCWKRHYEVFGQPTGKPTWQTEISGFAPKRWLDQSGGNPVHGGFSLGLAIQMALLYGKVSAWVWWQGTDSNLGQYGLTGADFSKGVTFFASKQFYRFIRPGAVMVDAASTDAPLVVTAFEHAGLGNFVIVICNDSDDPATTSITGDGVPASFNGFVSSAAAGDTCRPIGEVQASSIAIPGRGIVTLVNGSYREKMGETVSDGNNRGDLRPPAATGMHLAGSLLNISSFETEPISLAIFDLRGKAVHKLDNLRGAQSIDLSTFRAGIYMVTVQSPRRGTAAAKICIGKRP
jgi:glucuronoarabinoxylan endo-1,4-beta-xylanase